MPRLSPLAQKARDRAEERARGARCGFAAVSPAREARRSAWVQSRLRRYLLRYSGYGLGAGPVRRREPLSCQSWGLWVLFRRA